MHRLGWMVVGLGLQDLAETSVSKDTASKVGMAAFSRGVTWFGRQVVQVRVRA
jgi:hypothetical protein